MNLKMIVSMPKSRLQPVRQAGFTLIELLIVVSILGIVAGLAVPMLGQTDDSKLVSAANMLIADIAYAQIESISHADDVRYMIFDTATNAYYIAAQSDQATPITNPIGHQPYRVIFGKGTARPLEGVKIKSYSLNGDNKVQFGMYGQLDQATAASITLQSVKKQITLTIDPITAEVSLSSITNSG